MSGVDERTIAHLLLVLDLAGTFVFAISGALLGVQRRLDLFGVFFLSFAASTAGGITRDLLMGAVPPAAIADWRYLAVAVGAGALTFVAPLRVAKLQPAVLVFDAGGLSLFAVAGAQKALAHDINPVMSALLGMLTGIGGGVARDLLVARTPPVLESGLYAFPALIGAAIVVVGQALELPIVATALSAAALCFAIRVLALRFGWNLPVANP